MSLEDRLKSIAEKKKQDAEKAKSMKGADSMAEDAEEKPPTGFSKHMQRVESAYKQHEAGDKREATDPFEKIFSQKKASYEDKYQQMFKKYDHRADSLKTDKGEEATGKFVGFDKRFAKSLKGKKP